MRKIFTKPVIITTLALLAALFTALYFENRPARAPGQQSLTDIKNIDTLRTQFNSDVGKIRLIILGSPT